MGKAASKYAKVYETLKNDILSGKYASDMPFPSVARIIRSFKISNLTAVKVLAKLKEDGLVCSYQGRGTFVTKSGAARKIGLIVPGVAYSEFFPPIVGEISRLAQENRYTLLFADVAAEDAEKRVRKAKRFAADLVKEHVAGVVYQPLEFLSDAERVNREIVSIFDAAKVPVVLIDYDIVSPPERSAYDVVGINNPDAGYRLAVHLMEQGARNIHFLMRPNWAPSVRNRLRGVMSAVNALGAARKCKCSVLTAEPEDLRALKRHLKSKKADAFICGNDTAAAVFRQTLEKAGLSVPQDILLAAFDDVRVASLLTPPLTTVRQPCAMIGRIAFERLIARIANPQIPAQDIFLAAPLVARESTKRT